MNPSPKTLNGQYPTTHKLKHLVYAYLIGMAASLLSASIANHAAHWNTLFAAILGIASAISGAFSQASLGPASVVMAAALVSVVFLIAEALRSTDSWLRWMGYAIWFLLAVASFVWFVPPNI